LANPCRGFTAALSVTDSGGEIVALDAAGYGVVTVNKSVTITANPGFYAGISAGSAASGVTVNTAGIRVILRGLNINGLAGSLTGVNVVADATVTIENCVISNFEDKGVRVSSASARVRISDSVIRGSTDGVYVDNGGRADVYRTKLSGNSLSGLHVNGDIAATTSRAMVSDSEATGNGSYGFFAEITAAGSGSARMSVTRSTASFNGQVGIYQKTEAGDSVIGVSYTSVSFHPTGLENSGTGTFYSVGNNAVMVNNVTTMGPITAMPSF
jgi:hypothetical protein